MTLFQKRQIEKEEIQVKEEVKQKAYKTIFATLLVITTLVTGIAAVKKDHDYNEWKDIKNKIIPVEREEEQEQISQEPIVVYSSEDEDKNESSSEEPHIDEESSKSEPDGYSYEDYMALEFEQKYNLMLYNDYYGYTEEDYEYLVMAIVGEAQNCNYEHQMGVASVVINRYNCDKYFPYGDSIKSIVTRPHQYSCFKKNGGAYLPPTQLNQEVAMEVLRYGSIFPANVVFQAEFKQGDGVYKKIGNTYFCYLSKIKT